MSIHLRYRSIKHNYPHRDSNMLQNTEWYIHISLFYGHFIVNSVFLRAMKINAYWKAMWMCFAYRLSELDSTYNDSVLWWNPLGWSIVYCAVSMFIKCSGYGR